MTSKRSRHNGEGSIYPNPRRNGYAAYVWVTTPAGTRRRKYVSGKTREDVHPKFVALHQGSPAWSGINHHADGRRLCAGWLEEVVRPNLAPATASNYDLFTRLYITPDLGSRRLDKITVRDVQIWVNQLRTRCQCCAQGKDAGRTTPRCRAVGQCCRQVASEWTVHQAWAVLRSALSAAVRDEVVGRNVAALVRMPVPRPGKPTVWTVDQVRRFLESARNEDDPLYAGYALMLVLGLRRGEVLGLGWEDVDEERAEARIRWQVQRLGGRLVRRPTKTVTSDGLMPLPDVCLRALRRRRRIEDEWKVAAGEAWQA